ncbi:PilZ domain-containing protein [Myxococcota bacterium]|nr:PilZ domain-containing protein [Myxococcota bacterium]MBU1535682.1 PilZ domain-containing protein [Myxococcota bacterium]
MNYLRANYLNTEEFLDAWNGDDNHLFCPTVQELSIGQEIIVELHIPSVHDKTLVRGSVISFRRPVPRRGIRGGALVLVETDELEKVLYLVGLFEQGISKPEKRRKHPRLSVELPIRFRIIETAVYHDAILLDIAEGGARMRTKGGNDLVGEKIFLEITVPGGVRPVSFLAEVKNKPSEDLYGIAFMSREKGNFSLLREFLRRLKSGEFFMPVIFFSVFFFFPLP